ncbi:hypothetical protein [Terracoccus sp. 273MFTsu3.1]|uniref:hypothetical protein n=1 Tax=Terracoccus sp. 273MFTsu3.1 TaxID=1172188 RepID=UPI00037707FF|nr:hypothetical protein [Terracoccus sp. 273MFTsu3.1]
MPTAYVVLSHTEADQVTRLVHAILRSSPEASVFVTHDARRTPAPVIDDDRVHVRSHGRPTDWGSWDLVEVTLEAMREARDTVDPDLLVLVSGQCYPVRPLAAWEDELVAAGGWQGTARELAYAPAWGSRHGAGDDERTRYTHRWYPVGALDGTLRSGRLPGRALWALAHRTEPLLSLRLVARGRGAHVGIRGRMPSGPSAIHLGSQWLAVDREHLDLVLRELEDGTPLRRLYERSVIPDESALQTVLARHRPPTVASPVSYSVWVPEDDATRTFELGDLDAIRASGSPFCRKVHTVRSAELMDALDRVNGVDRGE